MFARLVALVAVSLSLVAQAQPLIDKIPRDAMIYIGWTGGDSMPSAYGASHLKAMLDASKLPEVFTATVPALIERVGRDDPRAAETMSAIVGIGGPMWHHPTALYFGGVDLSNPQAPSVKLAAICQAGADAPVVLRQVEDLIAKAGPLPIPLRAVNSDGLVVVTLGQAPELEALVRQPGPSLKTDGRFTAALAQVGADPVMVVYLDAEAVTKQIDDLMGQFASPNDRQKWDQVRTGLGLASLRRIMMTGSFDGKDWTDRGYIEAPAPRSGLVAMLAGAPMDDAALKLVPQGATFVSAGRLDLAATWDGIEKLITSLEPRAQRDIDQGKQQIVQALGFDPITELLPALGDQWAYYWDPMLGGSGLLSGAIVSPLRDAAKAEKLMIQAQARIEAMLKKEIRSEDVSVRFKTTEAGGVTIHYLAVPLVAPSWAIKGGNLYAGLYPQVVASAMALEGASGSVLDNPKFAALAKRLGDPKASAMKFIDLPALAPQGYSSWMAMSRIALGMADLYGVPTPAMLLPPMDQLAPHLSPSGGVMWADAQGIHWRELTPFPGADTLSMDLSSSLVGPYAMVGVSVLLPSLNRARETANRVKCASNMRQIGMAILLYGNENRNKMPPDLGTLVLTQDIGAEVFVCPSAAQDVPPPRGGDPKQAAEWVNAHADYIYIGAGRTNSIPADEVVLYEKPDNHNRDGMNLLYGDGHVEFQSFWQAAEEIQKVTGQDPFSGDKQ